MNRLLFSAPIVILLFSMTSLAQSSGALDLATADAGVLGKDAR